MLASGNDFGLGRLCARRPTNAFGINGQARPVYFQRGLGAAEFDAAVVHASGKRAGEGHGDAPRIFVRRRNRIGALPVHEIAIAHRHRGFRRRLAHVPLDDVDPVRQQVGKNSASEVPEKSPPDEFLIGVGLVGSVTEKLFPVQLALVNGRERHSFGSGGVVLIPVGVDEGHLAKLPGVHDLFAELVVLPTALLHAGLHHAAGPADRADYFEALGDRVHDRLLTINVFAGLDGVEEHLLVPMVRRADDDRVHVFAVQDLAVLASALRIFGGAFESFLAVGFVDVAYGDDFDVGDLVEQAHQVLRALPGAQHTDAQPLACAQRSCGRETAESQRYTARRGSPFQEISSIRGHWICSSKHKRVMDSVFAFCFLPFAFCLLPRLTATNP